MKQAVTTQKKPSKGPAVQTQTKKQTATKPKKASK